MGIPPKLPVTCYLILALTELNLFLYSPLKQIIETTTHPKLISLIFKTMQDREILGSEALNKTMLDCENWS